jgi:tetratricopeptide (TPR) repeat protein
MKNLAISSVLFLSAMLPMFADAEPTTDKKAAARELYERGTVHYRSGELEQAASEFKASYETYPLPETLFNLAQTHRLLHHYEKAIFYYRQYEATAQLSEHDRESVDARIKDVQREQEREQQHVAPIVTTPTKVSAPETTVQRNLTTTPVSKTKPAYKKWWVWTVTGLAVAAAATGIAVGVTQGQRTENSYPSVHVP